MDILALSGHGLSGAGEAPLRRFGILEARGIRLPSFRGLKKGFFGVRMCQVLAYTVRPANNSDQNTLPGHKSDDRYAIVFGNPPVKPARVPPQGMRPICGCLKNLWV